MNKLDYINLKKAELTQLCQTLALFNQDKSRLEREIKNLSTANNKLVLTDHAIIRYFERVLKLDVDKVRDALLSKELETKYNILGDSTFDMGDHLSVVHNGYIVTIIGKDD